MYNFYIKNKLFKRLLISKSTCNYIIFFQLHVLGTNIATVINKFYCILHIFLKSVAV